MHVNEVICRLKTEHEVHFLLTSYVETLQFCGARTWLPPGVAALPLQGVDDIEARFNALMDTEWCGRECAQRDAQKSIANEVTEIFGAAVTRLKSLLLPARRLSLLVAS